MNFRRTVINTLLKSPRLKRKSLCHTLDQIFSAQKPQKILLPLLLVIFIVLLDSYHQLRFLFLLSSPLSMTFSLGFPFLKSKVTRFPMHLLIFSVRLFLPHVPFSLWQYHFSRFFFVSNLFPGSLFVIRLQMCFNGKYNPGGTLHMYRGRILGRNPDKSRKSLEFSSLLFTVTYTALHWDFYFFKLMQPLTYFYK